MFEKVAEEIANKKLCSERICYNHCNFNSSKHHRCGEWHRIYDCAKESAEFSYNKANEWHNLNKNYKDLPNEGEWVEGLYIWYYKGEPHWDVFKVRWYYEIGELDEKLVRWYGYDENNSYENKIDEPDYWRKITLPMRNEYDRNY